MKSFTSIVGWLLLAALIAVPSFLFYNWWANTKNSEAAAMTQPSPGGRPPGAIFPGDDKPAAAVGAAQKPPSGAFNNPAPAASPVAPVATPAPANKPAPAGQAAATAAKPAPSAAVGVSTHSKLVSYFNPKTSRDPTMSPEDYQKIRDEEQRRREEERLARLAELQRNRVVGPETWLKLQGIVGNQVIINGEMYSVGMSVRGVKILKIGSDYIIGEYKAKGEFKRFKKVL
ncbi:MAG: hypothetical protein HY796_09245 [Elusimicrobia bacterium]|nr:hypothetical protein [Elusimicrobiota bacterium]